MKANLNKIAKELYGKIQTRFSDIQIGDENAEVLSRKDDIPEARFFEFEYEEAGKSLGTIAITLDEDDGVVVQISGDLAERKHPGAFKFIRSFRQFAKDRLLNFDVQNIGKNNLDKRDYTFQAKRKEQKPMELIMENRLYGTARMSYQDLGDATLIIRHSQPVNPELTAGRTMHIEGIWVENAQGERFKYPMKHLNGARALAEHIKAGGNPYDTIGKHIIGLSEELTQLRKFKGYVGRNSNLAEAMGDITIKVMERIEQVKKEISLLQRPTYYAQFAESFEDHEEQMIPEEIMSDWIDRLTIRTFNEELKTAFPYIFKLVSENDIPVKELSAEELLAEKRTEEKDKHGNVVSWKEEGEWKKASGKDGRGKVTNLSDKARRETEKLEKKDESYDPLEAFESFIDTIVNEDEEEPQGIFSPYENERNNAVKELNNIFKTELKGGVAGSNVSLTIGDLIPDTEFLNVMKGVNPELDARAAIEAELVRMSQDNEDLARAVSQIDFHGGDAPAGGEDLDTSEAPPAPPAPPPAPLPAPDASMPPAPPPAPPAPMAENNAKLKAKLIRVLEAGADLDTKLDFGYKVMTIGEAMESCGMTMAVDEPEQHEDPTHNILKSITGFWSPQKKNFTIGGTKVKIKVLKGFKDGEYPGAKPKDVKHVIDMIEKMDPSTGNSELGRIKQLSGASKTVDEGPEEDFGTMMQQFMSTHQGVDPNQLLDKFKQSHPDAKVTQSNTSSGTINGQPASYDDAMKNMPKVNFGGQDFDFNNPDDMGKKIQGMVGNQFNKIQGQVPNQNVQFPGGQMNPADMMKGIMSKMNFGK